MEILVIILGIILFAIASAVLYVWGLHKSITQRDKLQEILYQRAANKIVAYLKKNNQISKDEIMQQIKNIMASEFYSKNKAKITDVNAYSDYLCDKMIKDNIIEKDLSGFYKTK